jgi:hypothetical protein
MYNYGIDQSCEPEYERIRIFWLDPNPTKKFGFWIRDTVPGTVVKLNFFCEKSQIKHKKEKKTNVFQLEIFFLYRTDSRTHIKAQ